MAAATAATILAAKRAARIWLWTEATALHIRRRHTEAALPFLSGSLPARLVRYPGAIKAQRVTALTAIPTSANIPDARTMARMKVIAPAM